MLPFLALGLQMNVFERGAAGIPTTTLATALHARIDQYTQTIDHHIGFESMTCSFACTLEEALDWLTNGLMRSCEVSGPDAEICWEGFLETIDAQIGQERRSVSLREMANRVRVRYTSVIGMAQPYPSATTYTEDTASITRYGNKDAVLGIGTSDSTEAGYYATTELRRRSNPAAGPSATIASGDLGEIRLTLTFAGWYTTLDWVVTRNISTTKVSTTTQVGSLLTTLAATNAFISTTTTAISSSGVTAMEKIEDDTSYRAKIEALFALGNGSEPYAWGVYEGRTFHADEWAGADPTTMTYQRAIGEAGILDAAGGVVAPWNVRPDAMYQVIELLDPAPVATQQDASARFYVARVTCAIGDGQISVQLEPAESTDLAAILITKFGQ